MKICVTGGAGFIGSHIVEDYVRRGHAVVVVDNLSTGRLCNIPKEVKFRQIDIVKDVTALRMLFQEEKFDLVSHHAAHIDLRASVDDPQYDAAINIMGSLNVLQACKDYGVKQLLMASSAGAVYGESGDGISYHRTEAKVNPTSPYGVSKYTMEQYAKLYSSRSLSITCLRYSNVYGPRQDASKECGVISKMIDASLGDKPFVIHGDGEQTRDYIYISDVVWANVCVIGDAGSPTFTIVNVSSNSSASIHTLLRHVSTEAYPIYVKYGPEKLGDIKHSRITNMGWNEGFYSMTKLEKGIAQTVKHYKSESEAKV